MEKEISCGIIIYQTNLIPRVVSGWFGITKPQKFFSEFLWVSIFRKEKGIKYLLLNDGNIWGFPKGLLEKGEDEKETAIREAKEETGLEDLKFKDFKERISYFYKKKIS